MAKFVIGLDYGSDSVRALIVDAGSGEEVSSSVCNYPDWAEGKWCDPSKNQFRQHPMDYIVGLEKTVKEALKKAPKGTAGKVVGLSVDTTGSTPVAVDKEGVPLALRDEFASNPNAMFLLWKDHTGIEEAAEINKLSKSWGGEDFTKYEGGIYSSEWYGAKILRVLRADRKVRKAACSWVEHCDWIPACLTGCRSFAGIKRSRCAAGHKAMWHASWGGLPSEEFLTKLDPLLSGLRGRLFSETVAADVAAGTISAEWAKRLGLPRSVTIGTGALDAHMGAVGGQIEPYFLSKVMGTSTCDMIVAPSEEFGSRLVRGICGQVDGSIVPGMVGLEAGQSAFGDVYAWFRNLLCWGRDLKERGSILPALEREASKLGAGGSSELAVDWLNGRRSPDADQTLTGALLGLRLGSSAPALYKALVEATAFGSKRIVERFVEEGVPVKGVLAMGGVAKKSPFVMQTCADVLDMPIKVVKSEQACALGAAMFAATVSGCHKNLQTAMKKMGGGFEKVYKPKPENAEIFKRRYREYCRCAAFVESEAARR